MATKVHPIKPSDVAKGKKAVFPDAALQAFNELIAKGYSNGSATVKQDDVLALMVKKGLKRKAIFDNHWLDVEELYEDAGWEVEYDKPGFNESYSATFKFSRR